jgi:hypothetical protein
MKLIEIKSKKTYTYRGNVYDLEVEDNHSYNVNGILVHNSDYVMIGSIFNKAMQSAGFNYLWGIKIKSYSIAKILWKWGFPIKKKYRGMSTKAVQRSWGKTRLVTAEGITKYQKVEYNLSQWVENFRDYLRSAMSYCSARNLQEFIGEAEWIFITDAAIKRFKK